MLLKNLAFVTSSLQLMNLRELCTSQSIDKKSFQVIIKYSKTPASAESLKKEMARDKESWGSVLTMPNRRKFLHTHFITKKLQNRNWYFLVSGEINSWWQNVIAANISYKERVIVDDGTMTVFDYHTRLNGGFTFKKSKMVKNLALKAMGLKRPSFHNEKVKIFTIFPLASKENIKIEKNELTLFKRSISLGTQKFIENEGKSAAFIGQPLTKEGLISEQEYLDLISDFSKKFDGKCIYFPHRSEDSGTLRNIKNIKGVEVVKHKIPIEKAVGSNNSEYQAIGGIYSTALFTLHILCPKTPIYFYPISKLKTASDKLVERGAVIENYLFLQENTTACPW